VKCKTLLSNYITLVIVYISVDVGDPKATLFIGFSRQLSLTNDEKFKTQLITGKKTEIRRYFLHYSGIIVPTANKVNSCKI